MSGTMHAILLPIFLQKVTKAEQRIKLFIYNSL